MVDRLVNSEANQRRIAHVDQCFGGSKQTLAVPGRVLVGEGVLTKMCRKRPKSRQFFLFHDILVYGNIVINKKKYNKQHILPLEDVRLKSIEDEGNQRNGWQIISTNKSFSVYAATATEKSEWMAHINKCISDLIVKSGKKPATDLCPVWVPDQDASTCMNCDKSKFTTLNRRHHCRKCGRVVCGNCSTKKFLLPTQSSRPLRVCDTCHDQLSTGKASQMDAVNPPAGSKAASEPIIDHDSSEDDDEDMEDEQENNTEIRQPTFYEGNDGQ
ncbi:pleckstrin homology domain-containing family F member 2-like [Anneissia japonica]|uniref:pleckstrin homology domain-containing family F member 2-like n=1 Tax=Anneissia japonica TaxID=1529436 RepID=UPI0014256C29|nr:pleckstrin homology domain-containing family F member 2-like [Anneissia japonica]